MKSMEDRVNELTGSDVEAVKVALPAPFYHRLVVAGRRRYGTIARAELSKKALVRAAALGLLAWEKELNQKGKAKVKKKP